MINGGYIGLNQLALTWTYINPYLKSDGGMVQMGYPWMAVLDGDDMSYYWSDYADNTKNLNSSIAGALAD